MSKHVQLICLRCGRRKKYPRSADASLPARVASIQSAHCDKCDNGDFGDERWFDAAGKEVSQDVAEVGE